MNKQSKTKCLTKPTSGFANIETSFTSTQALTCTQYSYHVETEVQPKVELPVCEVLFASDMILYVLTLHNLFTDPLTENLISPSTARHHSAVRSKVHHHRLQNIRPNELPVVFSSRNRIKGKVSLTF